MFINQAHTFRAMEREADFQQKTSQDQDATTAPLPPQVRKTVHERVAAFYKKKYKLLLAIPILLLVLSLAKIFFQYATTGDFVNKGVALTGGIGVEIQTSTYTDILALKQQLEQRFAGEEIDIRIVTQAGQQKSFIVEASKNILPLDLQQAIRETV